MRVAEREHRGQPPYRAGERGRHAMIAPDVELEARATGTRQE
jgi:hypothetical protein